MSQLTLYIQILITWLIYKIVYWTSSLYYALKKVLYYKNINLPNNNRLIKSDQHIPLE